VRNNSGDMLHIQPPSPRDIATITQRCPQLRDVKIAANAHLATPVLTSAQGVDIPLLQGCFEQHQGISLTRILAPYEWLVAEEDLALVQAFKSLFSCTIG